MTKSVSGVTGGTPHCGEDGVQVPDAGEKRRFLICWRYYYSEDVTMFYYEDDRSRLCINMKRNWLCVTGEKVVRIVMFSRY